MTPKTSLPAASGKHQNILAPASLVCGLLAWTLLPIVAALAAILTGHIAYAKDKRLKVGGKGMALTGLVLGYSGLGAAMMLIGIWAACQKENRCGRRRPPRRPNKPLRPFRPNPPHRSRAVRKTRPPPPYQQKTSNRLPPVIPPQPCRFCPPSSAWKKP